MTRLRKKIIHHHSKSIQGKEEKTYSDQTEARKILLDICDIPEINTLTIMKNAFLAREYLLQGREKELLKVLTETPEALYYQDEFKEEVTVKLLAEKPELLLDILFKKTLFPIPNDQSNIKRVFWFVENNYPIENLAEDKSFLTFLFLTNPNLLDINTEDCPNVIVKDIIENKKDQIKEAVEDLRKPLVKTNGCIENFKKINDLLGDNGQASKEFLKKFWFIAGIAKINLNIIHSLDKEEQLEKALENTFVWKKKSLLTTILVISKSFKNKNLILPKPLLILISVLYVIRK